MDRIAKNAVDLSSIADAPRKTPQSRAQQGGVP